jgi:hypothetical protein
MVINRNETGLFAFMIRDFIHVTGKAKLPPGNVLQMHFAGNLIK